MKKKEITDLEVKRIESETKKWHSENETLLKNIKDLYSRKLPLLKQQKLNALNKGEKESPLKLRMVKAVSFKEENKNQAAQGAEDERGGSSVDDSKNSASEDFRDSSLPSLNKVITPEHFKEP